MPVNGRTLSSQERDALQADMAQIVENSHLFSSLDAEGRDKLFQSGYVCSFDDACTILQEGEPGDTMYLVLHGKVTVKTGCGGNESMHLAELGTGACIGEVAVLTGQPRTATVTAKGPVDCVAFAAHRIARVLTEYPEVHQLLLSLIESRARSTIEKLIRRHHASPAPPPPEEHV